MALVIIAGFIVCIIYILLFSQDDNDTYDPWDEHYPWNKKKP